MEDKKKCYTIVISALFFFALSMMVINLLTPVYSIKYHQKHAFNGTLEELHNNQYFYNFAYEQIILRSDTNDTHVFRDKSQWPRVNYILVSTGITQIIGIIALLGYGFFVTPMKRSSNLRHHQTIALIFLISALLFTFCSLVPYAGITYAFRYSTKAGIDHTCISSGKYIHQCKSLSGSESQTPKYVSYKWGYDFGFWMEFLSFVLVIIIVPFNVKLKRVLNSSIDIIQIPNHDNFEKEDISEYDQFVMGLNKEKVYSIDEN